MAIQYVIHYDFLDTQNIVHPGCCVPFANRDDANEAWVTMKKNPCFQNMRPEKVEPKRHVVNVEYSKGGTQYTFETALAIKKGMWVVVETNKIDPYTGQTFKKKDVVQAVSDDHDEPESEIEKRFPIKRLSKVFGVVKTK